MLWKLILLSLSLLGALKSGQKNIQGWRSEREPFEPQTQEEERIAYEALQNNYEGGDMIIPRGELIGNGVVSERYRWTGYPGSAIIPYIIDSSVNTEYYELIQNALQQYSSKTCVQFKRRTSEPDYIRIVKEQGCWSHVGKYGGEQKLSLGDGCYYIGTIVHELGHAVGFMHEHQRSDRDRYIYVYPRNATSEGSRHLVKSRSNDDKLFNDFDYESVMMYGNYQFSKSIYNLQTLEAVDGTPLLEPFNKPGLDQSDAERVNIMYKC